MYLRRSNIFHAKLFHRYLLDYAKRRGAENIMGTLLHSKSPRQVKGKEALPKLFFDKNIQASEEAQSSLPSNDLRDKSNTRDGPDGLCRENGCWFHIQDECRAASEKAGMPGAVTSEVPGEIAEAGKRINAPKQRPQK